MTDVEYVLKKKSYKIEFLLSCIFVFLALLCYEIFELSFV